MSGLMVRDALDSLSPAYRRVLELSAEGQTQPQIAARLELGQVAYRVVGSGPSVAWCRGLLWVRRHDRDGSRVFVASVELPGPAGARRPP